MILFTETPHKLINTRKSNLTISLLGALEILDPCSRLCLRARLQFFETGNSKTRLGRVCGHGRLRIKSATLGGEEVA